ncbi:MAG: IS66 family transposase [Candidatus Cryptobacteroides sp.]
MGKDMIIEILKLQLEAANEANIRLNETMKSMEASFKATVFELRKQIASLESLLKERDESLGKANAQMRGLKATYLPKQSEKQSTAAGAKSDEQKAAEESARKAAIKARGNNGARRKDYFTVDTVEEDVYPENVDADACIEIGVRDVIRYEMIRPSFVKHIYHIHNLKKDDVIYSGATPLSPLMNSRFDGSFIAGIAELRYLYSMPVERIVKYFQGNGFDLDKQTAHGLLAKTADLFDKLYEAMGKAVKEGRYLHCDETYHTVLVKDDGKGSKKGYIWVIVNAQTGLSYFFYDDGSRSEKVILKELDGYKGIIQSDGLGAYKKVAMQSGGNITRVACLQHCKRAFLEDGVKDNPDAKEVASLANSLYHNEHQHKIGEDGWTIDDNLKWRQQYAPPILAALKSKLEEIRGSLEKYPPKSQMHKAANYFLNEWDGIETISKYGDVEWDNNRLERTNRYVSLSRHNSLFFGSHAGAKRGCIFYSLACSCREMGINFFDYLSDVLNRTAALPPNSRPEAYRNLLPDKWTKE